MKITENVSFSIASEANYVYILSGQKLIKNAKNGPFWRVFKKPEACGQTVLPDRSVLIGQTLVENAKIQMRHFEYFLNNVNHFFVLTNCVFHQGVKDIVKSGVLIHLM